MRHASLASLVLGLALAGCQTTGTQSPFMDSFGKSFTGSLLGGVAQGMTSAVVSNPRAPLGAKLAATGAATAVAGMAEAARTSRASSAGGATSAGGASGASLNCNPRAHATPGPLNMAALRARWARLKAGAIPPSEEGLPNTPACWKYMRARGSNIETQLNISPHEAVWRVAYTYHKCLESAPNHPAARRLRCGTNAYAMCIAGRRVCGLRQAHQVIDAT